MEEGGAGKFFVLEVPGYEAAMLIYLYVYILICVYVYMQGVS